MKSDSTKREKLFALWEYSGSIMDTPTTMLGSPIARFRDNGSIIAEGYGGAVFHPAIVLPLISGRKALEEFETLVEERRAAHVTFKKHWGKRYADLKQKHKLER